MKRFILFSTLLIWVVLGSFALYYVNRPVNSVTMTKPDYSLASTAFYTQFAENEENANHKYLGKVIELSGTVKEIGADENGQLCLTLNGDELFGISCKLNDHDNGIIKKYP